MKYQQILNSSNCTISIYYENYLRLGMERSPPSLTSSAQIEEKYKNKYIFHINNFSQP